MTSISFCQSSSSNLYNIAVDDRFNKVYVHLDRYEFGNLIEDQSDVSELELVIDHEEPGEIWLHVSIKPPNEELMFILGTQNTVIEHHPLSIRSELTTFD